MRRNLVKQRLKNGETIIGTMVQEVRNPSIAQIMKQSGFDFFMIDMEHGAYSLETAADILRVGRLLDMAPLVRVRSPDYDLIVGPLDQGAMGIMLPRVETRAHVETLVQAVKYPPMGIRGCSSDAPHAEYDFGPLTQFLDVNNEDTLVIAQIERKQAIENIDEILSVPGLDAAFIGPEDLSVSMGIPGETNHPSLITAVETMIEAAERHNIVSGIHVYDVESFERWHGKGMRLFMYGADLFFLMEASTSGLNELRALV